MKLVQNGSEFGTGCKPQSCDNWEVKAVGSKGKEVKGVHAEQKRKLFPLNAHKVGKVSSAVRNICICR